MLNASLSADRAAMICNGVRCRQIFSINYGLVEYVDVRTHRANEQRLANPITYTYLKDATFANEQELRISLSTLGIGQFALADGQLMTFPDTLQLAFDFRGAIASGAIERVLHSQDCDLDALDENLRRFGLARAQAD